MIAPLDPSLRCEPIEMLGDGPPLGGVDERHLRVRRVEEPHLRAQVPGRPGVCLEAVCRAHANAKTLLTFIGNHATLVLLSVKSSTVLSELGELGIP